MYKGEDVQLAGILAESGWKFQVEEELVRLTVEEEGKDVEGFYFRKGKNSFRKKDRRKL